MTERDPENDDGGWETLGENDDYEPGEFVGEIKKPIRDDSADNLERVSGSHYRSGLLADDDWVAPWEDDSDGDW